MVCLLLVSGFAKINASLMYRKLCFGEKVTGLLVCFIHVLYLLCLFFATRFVCMSLNFAAAVAAVVLWCFLCGKDEVCARMSLLGVGNH